MSIVSGNDVSGLTLLQVDNCYVLFMETAHAKQSARASALFKVLNAWNILLTVSLQEDSRLQPGKKQI